MGKFLSKRHKFQSTKEVDFRKRKAQREAGVSEPDLFSMEKLQRSTRGMRDYFLGGDYVLDMRHRRGPVPFNAVIDLEIDVHLRSDPHGFTTGFEGLFAQRPHITFLNNREYWIDAIVEPGIAVAQRDFTDSDFLGRGDQPCPNCGRFHATDWLAGALGDIERDIIERLRDHLAIPGEAIRVQEHNLLPHHKDQE